MLTRDLGLGPGTNTLDVDIPSAHVAGALTFDGGPAAGSGNDEWGAQPDGPYPFGSHLLRQCVSLP